MVDLGQESDLRRGHRVVLGQEKFGLENATCGLGYQITGSMGAGRFSFATHLRTETGPAHG